MHAVKKTMLFFLILKTFSPRKKVYVLGISLCEKNPKHHIFLKSVFQHILHRAYALNKDRILCTKKSYFQYPRGMLYS